ncbi:MAG TPA: SUMF1/EgtB/PvdO family nonheme iron enzyme [Candidatus Krumholzibacteria bacterium]|nr:SUMF1/EgtB/PvdO family nonheme iron enzyme [Candidatus Krumholzibacteria bacterium]HPD72816.1 SUMF1/EgtB/PvdO family nonheme iron enzyme [Candidatus Krumholzibacteria bacterium]HRY40252.1 SUMF1/EgtB/PvdO family nonheme iron enzyme [Candidatus Krumholzibacteria bacterium]
MPVNVTTRTLLSGLALFVIGAGLAGCGQQDLYEAPGSPYEFVGRLALPSANEGVAVIGRTAFVAGGEAGLHTVDWSNPASPQLLATLNTTKYADDIQVVRTFTGGVLRDIAHIVEGTEGVTSYDVTDAANPVDYLTGTTAVVGRSVFIVEDENPSAPYVVFVAEDWKGVRVFESVPADPGILAYNGVFVGTLGNAYAVAVRDGWGYCAQDELGLGVLDLRVLDLNSVALVAWADTPGNARAVAVEGDYAFVADGLEGLAVLRIDGGNPPVKVAQYDLSGYSEGIALRDGLVALAANGGGVHFLDVSDPVHPIYLGTNVTTYSLDVAFSDDGYCLVADESDGLVIFGGRGPFRDTTPPAAVIDLIAQPAGANAIDLEWTMTGDDRMRGTAASVEVRQAAAPITDDAGWDAATPVAGLPAPAAAGTPLTHTVTGLERDTAYHFALRVVDDAGLVSALSNPATATTAAGIILRNPSLDLAAGTVDDTFTYEVEALWEGEFTATEVIIDGTPQTIALVADDLYRFQTSLAKGVHTYAFRFAAEGVADATTAEYAGPAVGEIVFTMGSPDQEYGRDTDEVRHLVAFGEPVIAAATEVTQAEWDEVMPAGSNPSQHPGAARPVDSVTWHEAVAYCNARSVADDRTPAYTIVGESVSWDTAADGWRLPTEAEWEYLCRAGTTTAFFSGELVELNCRLDPNLDAIGWYCGNAGTAPEVVAQKLPNAFGLYDPSGNVREWCWDWYGDLPATAVLDPAGPATGAVRICRGGSWFYSSQDCRSAARGTFPPDSRDDTVGFRVVRTDFAD